MITVVSVLGLGGIALGLYALFNIQAKALSCFFWPGLLAKVVAGVLLGLVYAYYYTVGDTFGFFDDATQLTLLIKTDFYEYLRFLWAGDETFSISRSLVNSQERSLFMVKLVSVILPFSFGNYWIASVYVSILSFLGSWYMVAKIHRWFVEGTYAAVISFLFIPSFLFWSSGIVKESLAVGSLVFLSGWCLAIAQKEKIVWWEWIVGLLSLWLLWSLKYYWAALFVPAVLSTIIVIRIIRPFLIEAGKMTELITWMIVFVSIVLAASRLHPNFYLDRFLAVIVENNQAYEDMSGEGPFIHFNNLQPAWTSIIQNSPWAFISGLFRPFIFESRTVFQAIVAVENTILLLLVIYNFRYISKIWQSDQRLLITGALFYILLLVIFLALSTPNLGTLSRYRIGFLPLLFYLMLFFPVRQALARYQN